MTAQIVDLQIEQSHRGHGYGSEFLRAIERIAAAAGHAYLFLSVAPQHNPRAYALYQRMGYQPVQSAPYRKRWHFIDSAGTVHRREDWIVEMVKPLTV